MNATDKNILDSLTDGLTVLVAGWMRLLIGPAAERHVFGEVTVADIATALYFLILFLVVNVLVAAFVRRKIKHCQPQASAPAGKPVQHHVFSALGRPVYLLIWVYGIYFALTPLLLKLNPHPGVFAVRVVFDKLFDLGIFVAVIWLFFRFTHVLETHLAAWAARTDSKLDDLLVPLIGRSLRIVAPVLAILFARPLLGLPAQYDIIIARGSGIALIVAVALILAQAVRLGEKVVLLKYDITVANNLAARKIYTQVHVISKTLYFVIALFAVASVLMLFEEVRRLGTSILASAGVVGVILGFAAQKTIANLFAGFQLAMTQPIRLDDVVIVESEWGNIEEITLTYVVIRIWDERRLVVPLSYFIEKPFQNWTRSSSSLLGSVFLNVDYTLPLEEIRRALKEIIEPHPLWDKRFWNLQVTDATEKTMQLRVLATSADSSKSWDLRCAIREQLIAYVQKHYPQSLPQFRAEVRTAEEFSHSLGRC